MEKTVKAAATVRIRCSQRTLAESMGAVDDHGYTSITGNRKNTHKSQNDTHKAAQHKKSTLRQRIERVQSFDKAGMFNAGYTVEFGVGSTSAVTTHMRGTSGTLMPNAT
ncbi:uncharacterized protein PHALS_06428 [Plasmopara halstedii]|uniref:Uncharacterized protein n=1 Tax=Plasmopara halstedii TaxID=4781 RepID=A0A0P1B3F2_PLAHL|nr:uncharacterized protein PHALS_06428 [Plasmopara halstedii]CEG48615.1 hypothetical protein PHALS_06428 [Plasmopara halstedii]|eukprot:XP_024584984.1 hypothetical protein PHALS_06428 [Plasmopara halstedii]